MKFWKTKFLRPVAEPRSVAVNTIWCSWNVLYILHIWFNSNFSIIYEKRKASFLNSSQAEVTILFSNKWRSARAYWYLNWIVLWVCWSVGPHFCPWPCRRTLSQPDPTCRPVVWFIDWPQTHCCTSIRLNSFSFFTGRPATGVRALLRFNGPEGMKLYFYRSP